MNYLMPLLALVLLLAGCKGDVTKLNDENPYYRKGLTLTEEGRYDEAVRAFRQVLRYSPESYKAHLQLAILYEDNLQDLPRAIVHYQSYIRGEPDLGKQQKASTFLERAEESYYLQLHQRYRNLTMPAMPTADRPPPNAATAEEPPPPLVDGSPADPPLSPVPPTSPTAGTPAEPPPADVAEPAEVAEPTPAEQAPPAVGQRYTVEPGDNLSRISRKFYGTTGRWRDIYNANRATLSSPDRLRVGQELIIPE